MTKQLIRVSLGQSESSHLLSDANLSDRLTARLASVTSATDGASIPKRGCMIFKFDDADVDDVTEEDVELLQNHSIPDVDEPSPPEPEVKKAEKVKRE